LAAGRIPRWSTPGLRGGNRNNGESRNHLRHAVRRQRIGIILGAGQFNFDLSILKTTNIRERQTIQFRAEFFNTFNHPQFTNPNYGQGAIYALPNFAAGNFGQITSTSVNPRIVQLALKYIF
jgi:hypothetical protein